MPSSIRRLTELPRQVEDAFSAFRQVLRDARSRDVPARGKFKFFQALQ